MRLLRRACPDMALNPKVALRLQAVGCPQDCHPACCSAPHSSGTQEVGSRLVRTGTRYRAPGIHEESTVRQGTDPTLRLSAPEPARLTKSRQLPVD